MDEQKEGTAGMRKFIRDVFFYDCDERADKVIIFCFFTVLSFVFDLVWISVILRIIQSIIK